eukprot:344057-Hanusia_phi.AAC.1
MSSSWLDAAPSAVLRGPVRQDRVPPPAVHPTEPEAAEARGVRPSTGLPGQLRRLGTRAPAAVRASDVGE